jgi:hypothetical protein
MRTCFLDNEQSSYRISYKYFKFNECWLIIKDLSFKNNFVTTFNAIIKITYIRNGYLYYLKEDVSETKSASALRRNYKIGCSRYSHPVSPDKNNIYRM